MRVHREADGVVPCRLDLRGQRLRLAFVAARHCDAGPGQRQRPCDRLADAAIAPGHVGRLALQVELARKLALEIDAWRDVVHRQSITRPPLRSTISPVMKPASGEARKRTTCANSSGSQKRPTGMSFSRACRCCSVSCSVIM